MTDGRTYMVKSVQLNPDFESEMAEYWRLTGDTSYNPFKPGNPVRPDKHIIVETPYVVPDGKWVLGPWARGIFVGASRDDLEEVRLDTTECHINPILYVSDKPFGFVTWETKDPNTDMYVECNEAKSLHFVSARQIHKGEVGRRAPMATIDFAAEKPLSPQEGANNGDRARARMGWVRLADLIDASHYTLVDIIDRLLPFACQVGRFNETHNWEYTLDIVVAASADKIKGKSPEISQVNEFKFRNLLELGPSYIWVRRGFANTVLRLAALDFVFEPATV